MHKKIIMLNRNSNANCFLRQR